MRENLGSQTHADALGALRQQEREAYGEFGRLEVAAVVGVHPVGDLGVENHLFGKLAESRLDVSRRGVGVTGEDVSPVTLTIHGEALLTELDKGAEYGLVAVRVVLHRLTDDVRHLRERAVIHLVHSVKHASLDGFQTVGDVGHGTMKDYV